MERLYRWNTPEQQSSLLAVIRKGSPGFVLFPEGKEDQSILSHFGAIVAQYPNRLAVKGRHSSYTYSELDLASNAIAAAVRTENDGRNPNVAVFIEQDAQMIACILGILKAGSIYVPLDPSLTGTRNSVILDDSLAKTVFTDSANRERAKALFGSNCRIFDVDEVISRGGEAPLSSIAPEDLACIIYTSGSTGRPRGVLHTHRTVVQMAKRYANAKAVSVNDRVSLFYSCSVAASLGNIFGPLLSGAALLSFNVRALGFSALANWLKEEKISVYHSSPSVFRATFESMPADEILPHARIVRIGGDMAYKSDFDLFKHRVKPGSAMVNAYGCSEMSTLFCFYMTPESVITEPILPVGCPVDDTEIAVLDEHGEIAQPGTIGDIAVRSSYLSPGYWNKESAIRGDQVLNHEVRVYLTGDRGMVSSGCLIYQGRKDAQVKIRGHRIELAEVESNLRLHPMVKQAVVVSKKLTEQDKCLVAYVVLQPESNLTAKDLSAFVTERLPQYMQPAAYVLKEKLPQTEVGKIDRLALAALPMPAAVQAEYIAPQGATEKKLAAIWAEIFNREPVSRQENFFHLGGHSVLAIRMVARLRQALGVEASIGDLFANPVLADLAAHLERAKKSHMPEITRAERGARIPLSLAQQRLWFLAQMEGVSEAYHMAYSLRLHGELNAAALRRALNRIVQRHEALRTTFIPAQGNPEQRIGAAQDGQFYLLEHDLRRNDDKQAESQRLILQESCASFDLEKGPLIRGRLIQFADNEHTLLITMHHIVSDGWSMWVLLRDLSTLYGAYVRGEADPLPELSVQYVDYAMWQRQWMEAEMLGQAEYWKKILAGAPEALELPADHARPARQDYAGAFVDLALEDNLSVRLRKLSASHGTTLYVTLLTGWAVLLARLSGQDDVVIGSPAANRGRLEIENLVGFFVNTLALRVDVSGTPSTEEVLERVKEQTISAQQHQDIPFEQVVEAVNPPRSPARSPLFQVMFAWQSIPRRKLELPGLEVDPVELASRQTSKFDLTLFLRESGESIRGGLEYATALFERKTIDRYAEYYLRLLEGMVEDQKKSIHDLGMLGHRERQQVLYDWNKTQAEYPTGCLHELIEEQAEKTPDAVALLFEESGLTYAELNQLADQFAHSLKAAGVKGEARVGICMERGLEMIVALLGILKAGGAYVPLDPAYPVERLRYMLADSGAPVLVTQAHLREMFGGTEEKYRVVEIPKGGFRGHYELEMDGLREMGMEERLAYVIYTSGSTGEPKGVGINHRSAVNFIGWAREAMGGTGLSRTLFSTSLNFDLSVYECFVPLTMGGTIRIVVNVLEMADSETDVTLMNTVPSAMRALVEMNNVPFSVQVVNLAGEELKKKLVEDIFANTEVETVCNLYGPTEATTYATWVAMKRGESFAAHIGHPVGNGRVYILDRAGEAVPVGVVGEIYIGGEGVARGYVNRAELTAERFIPDAYIEGRGRGGARMYRTGDLGRWGAGGEIQFLGRKDSQIKLRGYRIELGEIESRLMEYEGIKEAAVMVREEEDGEKRLVAYFVADPTDRDAKQRDVRETLRAELITEWAMTWDETYGQRGPAEDATFDIVGWNNSYRGQPIPRDDMRVWVETTAQRILSLKPKRVWEIGCGTGLLLFRIAPQCSYYRGTDVSEAVLDFLQKQMTRPGLNSLQLALDCKAAHEFDGTEEQGRFDTIVLNSVVQYFPDIEYLLMVLAGAVKSLTAGGTIFIGDVRSFPLLEALHVSAELDRSPDSRGCDELWNRVQEGLRHERELVIAQEFFTALQQRLPQIGRVEIQLKRGRAHNELSRYRYDVTLHVGKPALPMECSWMDWNGLHSGLDAIRELLARTQPEVLGVTRIPNARAARDTAAVRILGSSDRPATIGDLREQLAIDPQQGVEPEDLWALENELPYTLEVRWCRNAANSCDVLFRRTGITCAVKFPGEESQIRSLENYATDPLRQKLSDHMIPELRRWLKEKLPEYMVPFAYVRLEEMPLTANGKLDRKRLPAPAKNLYATRSYEAPEGDIETTVAEVWSEVLKVERVGRHDNFFAMGGHSLLAVRLIERLKQWGLHLEVGTLFAEPTVAQLAAVADPQSEVIKVPANPIPDHCKAIMPEMLPLVKLSREEIEQIESGVSGGAENIQDIYPLAPLQEGILFHHVMGGEGDLYLLRYEFSCEKRAQLDAYLKALQAVINRHDILRTAVVWEGLCEPVQVVWRKAVLQVEEVTLDEKEGDVAEQLYERCNPRRNRIDVRKAPMVRVHAAYDARENRWVVVQLLHHLVGDHVTLDVMREEIAAHFLGKSDKLPEPQPFRNLVAQSRLGAKQAEHETFFREMLGDVEEATKPFGLETIPGDGSDLESREMLLEPELGWRIRQQGRKLKVSVASLFHLAWARVLALLSGREDVVFGTVVLGRMGGTQGGERGLGMYINTLPVRIGKMDRGVEWNVGRVQALLAELMRHEHASLSLMQRCSGIKAPAPLFAALLNYRHSVRSNQNSAEEAKAWDGIQWLRKEGRSNYPVTLSADDWGDRFGFRALVPTWVGSMRMCGYLRTALASLVDALENAPETEVRNLDVMSVEEMRQVVYEWNGTAKELPGVWSVQKLFEEQVVRTPDTVAVEFEDTALSYRELNDRANRLAHSLRNAGVKTESRVGIQMRPGLEPIAAALGVMKAGGAYVSLNQEYPAAWLRYMVEDSGLEVILTQGEMEQEMDAVKEGLRVIEVGRAGETWNEGAANNPDWPSMGMTGEELAYVVYTPGPKGQPKGVMIEHRSLVNVIEWHRNETGTLEGERSPRISGSGLDAATWEIWSMLCTGATLVLAPEPKTTDEGMLLNRRTEKELDVSLLPAKIAETAVPGMGRAVENTRAYILAGEGMEPVPIGVVGELYIGGAGVGRGYINRPGLTAERFVPEPFGCDGTRMFKTGDLLKWRKDGTVEFAGRHDLQVTLRGFRVEIGEIEARLMEHAEVKAAAVVVREEQTEKRLIAYYTSAENAEITGDILRAYLSEILPVHMVPDVYVRLENMPLTAKGKADWKELTGLQGDASAERRYEAPAGELETAVAAVWAEVLNVERVGRHDDFFELGGRSLLVVQVLARLRLALGVEVEVSDLFEHPVLFDFVERVEGGKRSQLPVITRVDRSERIPLSFAQQRLWFLAQMEGGNEAYHMPLRARLKGRLDKRALKWALDRLVQRHEVLRTSFIMVEGEPQQRITPAEESSFELREINDSANELDRFVVEESRAKFDLEAGPLIRGRLVRESDEDHVLLITMHHIVSDGWSMGVLFKELNALYAAHVRGLEDPLPELPVQYADYAVWQQNWMEKAVMGEQGEYWRKNLLGAPELLEVPADHRRLEQQDYTGKKVRVELSEELTAGLKELSGRQGTTLYMTLLAGWAVLLGRLSGQDDVVVGTPVANRRQVELENLIGFFVNTLVMRMDVSGRPTVGEVLERVKKQALAVQQHQDIPFEQVVEMVQPIRSLAHSPLFQVMFAWQDAVEGKLELPGLEIGEVQSSPHVVSKFDLTLSLGDAGGRIAGGLEYSTALFERATIERYLGYYRRLLEGMAGAGEEEPVHALGILGEEERRQVLYGWNNTEAEHSTHACVPAMFEEQVEKTPDAVAVEAGKAALSYSELNRRANGLAQYLRGLGVHAEERVGICAERSLEMLVAVLGVMKAGGAYVPLDPGYPAERLAHIVENSKPAAVLTQGPWRELMKEIGEGAVVADISEAIGNGGEEWRNGPQGRPEQLAYVIYTSGSTGKAKGMGIEHRNTVNFLEWARAVFREEELKRVLFSTSLNFDLAVYESLTPLTVGSTVRIVENALELAEGGGEGVTLMNTVPSAMKVLVEGNHIPSSVRVVNLAGEVLKRDLVEDIFAETAAEKVCNLYGPTETTTYSTWREMKREEGFAGDIGRGVGNTRVYILNQEMDAVPVGVIGEICIAGAGVGRGYENRGDLTAERFVPDPYCMDKQGCEAGQRMYRTGDLGRWSCEGQIELIGRNDYQVKVRGYRIELGEIEARLEECEGVKEAVVAARESGTGDKRLVAYYTEMEDAAGDKAGAEEMRRHLASRLPEYMVPGVYVRLEHLPLTANGKLDRKALPTPEDDGQILSGYQAPEGEIETEMAAIWAEVLKLERVGRHDNFFSLGGHSLLAARLIGRMRKSGLNVDVRNLFKTPTVAELTAAASYRIPLNRIAEATEPQESSSKEIQLRI